jgi:uncharacterized membrane protein
MRKYIGLTLSVLALLISDSFAVAQICFTIEQCEDMVKQQQLNAELARDQIKRIKQTEASILATETATERGRWTPTPTNTPQPTATQLPTNTPQPTATQLPTNTPQPMATQLPTSTPEPTFWSGNQYIRTGVIVLLFVGVVLLGRFAFRMAMTGEYK